MYPIAGDASYRRYYRLISKKKTRILIYAAKEKYKNLIAYTAINQFLKKKGIITPKLFKHDFKLGVLIIEDFGNKTFQKILLKKKHKLSTYKKLVDLLVKMQKIKPPKKIKTLMKNTKHTFKKYNIKNLHKESDLFFDWYLPLFLNTKKISKIKFKAKKILSKIYKKLYFKNSHFVHRDYHASNLMKLDKGIGVIDTQDSLVGNPAYDLVSLIDDVRIKTSLKLKKHVFQYYLTSASRIYRNKAKEFLQDFNILSVQRSLKILGIFARLFVRDKKKQYLKLIPYTWHLLELRLKDKKFYELRLILNNTISSKIRKKIISNENK